MGYWSTHPMGGDTPLDYQAELEEIIGLSGDEEKEEYKEKIMEKLQELADVTFTRDAFHYDFSKAEITQTKEGMEVKNLVSTPYEENCGFVVPFTIAELGIQISDEVLSRKLKNMIGDGGAANREYDIPNKGSKEYPIKENNWNNLETPFDYARQLYDLWDDLMKGNVSFDVLSQDKGLFAAIDEAYSQNGGNYSGPVNKK